MSMKRLRKQVRYRIARIRQWWWAVDNWRKGYAFGPIQRCRSCTHTTPYHYPHCGAAA